MTWYMVTCKVFINISFYLTCQNCFLPTKYVVYIMAYDTLHNVLFLNCTSIFFIQFDVIFELYVLSWLRLTKYVIKMEALGIGIKTNTYFEYFVKLTLQT